MLACTSGNKIPAFSLKEICTLRVLSPVSDMTQGDVMGGSCPTGWVIMRIRYFIVTATVFSVASGLFPTAQSEPFAFKILSGKDWPSSDGQPNPFVSYFFLLTAVVFFSVGALISFRSCLDLTGAASCLLGSFFSTDFTSKQLSIRRLRYLQSSALP